jgi:hypothetical protein
MILQIPENTKTYDLRNSTIWFSPEGILYSVPKPESTVDWTNEEIQEEMRRFREIIGYKKVCMIAETHPTNSKQPSREQRSIFATEISSVTKAMAIVTSSSLSKMLANLFFAFVPPDYPVKMCKSEEEAKTWIKQYL